MNQSRKIGEICEVHKIGYVSNCPSCLFEENMKGMDLDDKIKDWERQLNQAEEYGLWFDSNTVSEMLKQLKKTIAELKLSDGLLEEKERTIGNLLELLENKGEI